MFFQFLLGPTVREFFYDSVRSASHAERTLQTYEEFLAWWEELTEGVRVSRITSKVVWKFREALLEQGLSPPTVNKHLRALRRIVNRALKRKKLSERPEIEMVPEAEPEPRTAEHEELAAIYHACGIARWPLDVEQDPVHPALYWRALVVTLYNVGLRRGEFLVIRFADLDFERGTLSLWSPKTKKFRYKPLHRVVVEHLATIRGPRELVFGKAKSGGQRYEQWKAIQRHAGICEPFFRFKDLRSTCGTAFFEESPGAAQEMLGHSSVETTKKHYARLSRQTRQLAETMKQPIPFYGGTSLPSPTIRSG